MKVDRQVWWVALISGLSSGLMVFVLLTAHSALADNDNNAGTESIPRSFHYGGDLDWDGEPYDGDVTMRFSLYGAPAGGEALWQEEHALRARRGRFSAELGSVSPVQEVITDAGTVFLGVEVRRPQDEGFVNLGNRQKLNPAPYALLATNSANLSVGGMLQVEGPTVLNGPVTLNELPQFQLEGPFRAVISANGSSNAIRDLGAAAGRICFLTDLANRNGGLGFDYSECSVNPVGRDPERWQLRAQGNVQGSASTECEAYCLKYLP